MRVLVTGTDGPLVRAVRQAWADDEVVALTAVDVTSEPAVFAAIRDHAPELAVCASAVDDPAVCDRDPQLAWAVNAAAPWWLARACALAGASVAHVSTAAVFDGALGRPYTEFDPPTPTTFHARTRAAGEQLVRQTLAAHYVVRCGWVLDDLVAGLDHAGEVAVDDAETVSPTIAWDLAIALRRLATTGRHGTFHLANAGGATRFEVASAAAARGAGATVTPSWQERGSYRVLEGVAARLAGVPPLDDWQVALARVVPEGRP